MEENNTQTEQPTPKKVGYIKKHYFGFTILLVSLLSIAFVSAAAIYLFGFPMTIEVKEPISSSTASLSISGYPGEEISSNISINNHATINQTVCLVYNGEADVSFTVDEIIAIPGDHVYPITVQIAPDANVGTSTINVTVSRGSC